MTVLRKSWKPVAVLAAIASGYWLWTFEQPIPIDPSPGWDASITSDAFSHQTVFVDVDGARLETLILMPRDTDRPVPAVLFAGGSGDVIFQNYRPGFLDTYLRDVFLPRGLAVVYVNKRGMGASTGNWQNRSIEGRAEDLITVAEALRARPEFDPDGVGYAGHSQGGWVVVKAGADDPRTAFVLNYMGPLRPPTDQFDNMWRNVYGCDGHDGKALDRRLMRKRRLTGLGSAIGATLRLGYLEYDARHYAYTTRGLLAELEAPMLAVYGGHDILVDGPANEAFLRSEFPAGVPAHLKAATFDGLNHGGFESSGICSDEPTQIPSPQLLDAIDAWLSENGM